VVTSATGLRVLLISPRQVRRNDDERQAWLFEKLQRPQGCSLIRVLAPSPHKGGRETNRTAWRRVEDSALRHRHETVSSPSPEAGRAPSSPARAAPARDSGR